MKKTVEALDDGKFAVVNESGVVDDVFDSEDEAWDYCNRSDAAKEAARGLGGPYERGFSPEENKAAADRLQNKRLKEETEGDEEYLPGDEEDE